MYRSPRDIARKLDVAEGTVYGWVRSGKLKAVRPLGTGNGKPILIDSVDADEFAAKRAIAV